VKGIVDFYQKKINNNLKLFCKVILPFYQLEFCFKKAL